MGSSERGGGRGAGRGGENKIAAAPRGVFVPLRGRDLARSRPGGPTVRRDSPGLAGALGSPPPSPPSGIPTPTQLPTLGPKFTGLLLPHPFTHPPPNCINPKTLKSGMGEGGMGAKVQGWAEYLLKGGCLLWNVDFFFLCPRNCFPLWASFSSPIPLTSGFPSFNSSKILKENERYSESLQRQYCGPQLG